MQEFGEVTESSGKTATVRLYRKASCENCNMCGFKKGDKFIDIKLINELGAQKGDKVAVTMADGNIVKSAAVVYVLPIIIAVLALGLAIVLKLSEPIQLLFAFGGLALSALIVFLYDKHLKKTNTRPQITAILEKAKAVDEKK